MRVNRASLSSPVKRLRAPWRSAPASNQIASLRIRRLKACEVKRQVKWVHTAHRIDCSLSRIAILPRSARLSVFLCLLALTAQPSFAQASQPDKAQISRASPSEAELLSSYEGQNVASIQIAGRPDLEPAQYSSFFVQKADQPFSQAKLDQTVAALKERVHADRIRVQADPEANGVRIQLILEPAVYFGIYQFPGAERFPYSRLIQVSKYPTETPFNAEEVEKARQGLQEFFQQSGYFTAQVHSQIHLDARHALANIAFQVQLGRQAKFGDITIADAPAEQAEHLKNSLQSKAARLQGAAIRRGKAYHRSTVVKAERRLQTLLQKRDFLSADAKLDGAEYHADTNRADIQFNVAPGPVTHIDIEGAHVWSWTRKSILPVYQGAGVDDESVLEGRQALTSFFQSKGYFDVKVESELKMNNSVATIVYRIAKEKKHKVAQVALTGNRTLASSELTPHIAVQKKHLFSPGKFSDQLLRASAKNLTAVYQAEGFSAATVTPSVTNRGGDIRVSFLVTEGPRDIVSSLSVEGADTFAPSHYAPDGLKLTEGGPYSLKLVQMDRANIIAHYLQAGYLNASFREAATSVSKSDPHHIHVVYTIEEGPVVHAGERITLGRLQTQQKLIDRDLALIKPGQPLTESQLFTSGNRLYDHQGVFDWAEVDPKRQITTQTVEDVLAKVHEAKRNELTYSMGFELVNRGGSIPSGTVALPNLPPIGLPSTFTTSNVTFYGPRGSAEYTRNNLRGKGESLSFTAFAGRLDQRGAVYFIDPSFGWTSWRSTTSVSAERNEQNPIFSSQQEQAGFQLQRYLDGKKKDTHFLRYSYSQTNLTRIEIPALVPEADQNVRLSTLAANITRDTRDNPLDEHKGMLQSLELDFNTTKLGSSVNFAKLSGQAAFYKQGFHHIVWANSLRIGMAQQFANSRVPLSEQFFTGGGNSLRGFPLDSAGPQREISVCSSGASSTCFPITVPAGGDELLLINSEARIPVPFKKGLGIVAFYDGGNAFSTVGFHNFTSLYSNNAGVGLRYATPVGPIRVDLGQNLNPVSGIRATQYFISIGQAF